MTDDSDPETDDNSHARLVGINHVALTVGDTERAREFYGSMFDIEVRGETDSAVFLDMGDQFLALSEGDTADEDRHRHVGLVVNDADLVDQRIDETEAERVDSRGLDFRDPWGNRIQVVEYDAVQFTKAEHVLDGMDLSGLEKTDDALAELAEKGMAPTEYRD